MPDFVNEHNAKTLIVNRFPKLNIHRYSVKDYAQIGLFLEDRARVTRELEELEERLRQAFQKHTEVAYAGPDKHNQQLTPLNLKRLLTKVLDDWDQGFHFNSLTCMKHYSPIDLNQLGIAAMQGENNLPLEASTLRQTLDSGQFAALANTLPTGSTPVLSGFVQPKLFRLGLLRLGYHWRDPGAGETHGDMTHRLQWFAITSAFRAGRLELNLNPLYLFQSLGTDSTWNENFCDSPPNTNSGPRALWDFLCDCFVRGVQDDKDNIGPFCELSSYRSPVSLQWDLAHKAVATVVSKLQEQSDNYESPLKALTLLRAIIAKRTLKMRVTNDKLSQNVPKHIRLTVEGTEGVIVFKTPK